MRNFSLLLITLCAVSVRVHAVDEIVITAAPYNPPSYTQHTVSLGPAGNPHQAAAIFQARIKACTDYAANQKSACDIKKEDFLKADIQRCDSLATNGTYAMIGGGGVATIVALASGPVGWAVLLVGGAGLAVAGGGALLQQHGNYACRDQANRDYVTNTLACNNYQAKIKADICSTITPNNIP